MNKNCSFTKLNSKMIAKICRTLIVLTLFAYLVDIILISSKSFSTWNFKNNTILTDFNIFIIIFCSFFFIFAIFYECFYNLKERIKIKILRYAYIVFTGLITCLTIFFCILMISKISKFIEIEAVMVFGIIIFLMFLFMFIFMLIDKIMREVFKVDYTQTKQLTQAKNKNSTDFTDKILCKIFKNRVPKEEIQYLKTIAGDRKKFEAYLARKKFNPQQMKYLIKQIQKDNERLRKQSKS